MTRPRVVADGPVRVVALTERAGVAVSGDIDLVAQPVWQQVLDELVSCDAEVVHLDLGGLDFVDVRGATRLVDAARRLAADGRRLVVHQPPASLRRVLEILWPDTSTFTLEA